MSALRQRGSDEHPPSPVAGWGPVLGEFFLDLEWRDER
jgi:hypothetical protein